MSRRRRKNPDPTYLGDRIRQPGCVPLVSDGHDDEDGDGEHDVVHGVEGLKHAINNTTYDITTYNDISMKNQIVWQKQHQILSSNFFLVFRASKKVIFP